MVISIAVSAVATIFIAYYAYSSHRLAEELRDSSKQHQQEFSDLLQALVIATILGGRSHGSQLSQAKDDFRQEYTGRMKIF